MRPICRGADNTPLSWIDFNKEVRILPSYSFMPILFLTTKSPQTRRAEARAAGAAGWPVKPATANETLSTKAFVVR